KLFNWATFLSTAIIGVGRSKDIGQASFLIEITMAILAKVKRFLRNVRDVPNRVDAVIQRLDAVIQRLDKFTAILEGLENQSQMFGHKLDSSIECLNDQAKTLSKNFQTLAHGLEDQSRGLKATVGFQKTLVMMQREQRELIENLARV